MAGLTFTKQQSPTVDNHGWRSHTIVAADNSYVTNGYSMKPTDLGFASTVDPDFIVEVYNTYGYGWRYDYTNQKLLFYTTAGTQTSSLADLSALTDIRVIARGKFKA